MDKSLITIRHAEAKDNLLLAEFGERTFRNAFAAENTPENMSAYLKASFGPDIQAEEMADPNVLFLIAELGDATVGYAQLKERNPPPEILGKRPIELVRIYVETSMIGHGIGGVLMEACFSESAVKGCDVIWLGVWKRNPKAVAFYRKWGFEAVGTHTFQLGDDLQTDLVMQRPIKLLKKIE